MGRRQAQTARDRIREANVRADQLYWFNRLATPEALDRLPGCAVLLPGESAAVTDTLVDLATGAIVRNVLRVPPNAVFGRLEVAEPFVRCRSGNLYLGQAGLSGRGVVTRSSPEQEAELTGEP